MRFLGAEGRGAGAGGSQRQALAGGALLLAPPPPPFASTDAPGLHWLPRERSTQGLLSEAVGPGSRLSAGGPFSPQLPTNRR